MSNQGTRVLGSDSKQKYTVAVEPYVVGCTSTVGYAYQTGQTGQITTSLAAPSTYVTVTNYNLINLGSTYTLNLMEKRVEELESQIAALKLEISGRGLAPTKDVSIEEAEDLVSDYLETNLSAYPSEISGALGISLKTTVEALHRLEDEGSVRKKK